MFILVLEEIFLILSGRKRIFNLMINATFDLRILSVILGILPKKDVPMYPDSGREF